MAVLFNNCQMNSDTFSYTVIFDANGGGGVMQRQDFVLGVPQILRKNAFTAPEDSDMYFAGWAASQDGKIQYKNEESVKNLADANATITLYARWGYKVDFNSDGGTAIPDQIVLPGETITRPAATITKAGNTFVFWYTDDYNTQWDFANQTVDGNMTLNARWFTGTDTSTTYYSVRYELNGAHDDSQYGDLTWPANLPLNQPDYPVKDNFTFGGWYNNPVFSGSPYNFNNPVLGSLTLYAKWRCTVSFDPNGGSPEPDNQVVDIGATLASVNPPAKVNYSFDAWYSDSSLTPESKWNFGTSSPNSNMTLYANWVPKQYTVSFDTNGGNNVPTQSVAYGNYVSSVTPVKTGYDFESWYCDSNFTPGSKWDFGASTVASTMTLYARWKNNVSFNADSGTPAPSPQIILSGALVPEPAPMSRGSLYAFKGWYTTDTFETQWDFGTDTVNSNMTLYAKWDQIPVDHYLVVFIAQGAVSQPDNEIVVDGGKVIQPDNPVRDGWIFDKWYRDTSTTPWDFVNNTVTAATLTDISNQTLLLNGTWIQLQAGLQYGVHFVTNGGSPIPADQVVSSNGKAVEPIPVMTKTDSQTGTTYTFGGWYSNAACTIPWVFTDNYGVTGTVSSLYAKWNQSNYYTANFITGGGTPVPAQQTVAKPSLITRPTDPQLTGYTFNGWSWYENPGALNTWNFNSNYVMGNTNLFAQWTANSYTVSYNGNGSTGGSMTNSPYTYNDAPRALTTNGYTRTGYTFTGWNIQANGSGTGYTDGQPVQNLASANGATVTLYAQWTPITYTVAYNANNGSGSLASSTHTYDAAKNLTVNNSIITRTGYTFAGWNTQADGSGVSYTNGQNVINLRNSAGTFNLYAQWTANTYTVVYNANGGSGSTMSSNHTYGTSKPLNANTFGAPRGKEFTGWNTRADGSGASYANQASVLNMTSVNGDTVILYAQWQIVTNPPGATLNDKLNWLDSNAISDVEYMLEANADESLSPRTLSYSGYSNVTIKLVGNGSERIINLSSTGSMFTVGSGVILVLGDEIILQGRNDNSAALIRIISHGSLIMNADSNITGNTSGSPSSVGGGVYVLSGGSFTMNGGVISNNATISGGGGGVYVPGGSFTMNGGEISNNIAPFGGGVYVSGGSFTMNSGEISNNTANATPSGSGGGVSLFGGSFTMSGGKISNNNAPSGGGGGVVISNDGFFAMSNGEISNNTAIFAGGVTVYGGSFTISGGAVITSNTASLSGGGVVVYAGFGSFTKTGGGTITGYSSGNNNSLNVVKNSSGTIITNSGHAVCVLDSISSTFIKRKENTAGPTDDLAYDGTKATPTFSGAWDY